MPYKNAFSKFMTKYVLKVSCLSREICLFAKGERLSKPFFLPPDHHCAFRPSILYSLRRRIHPEQRTGLRLATMQIFVKTRACPPGMRRARPPAIGPTRLGRLAFRVWDSTWARPCPRPRLAGRPERPPRRLHSPRPPKHPIAAAPRARRPVPPRAVARPPTRPPISPDPPQSRVRPSPWRWSPRTHRQRQGQDPGQGRHPPDQKA